MATSRASRAWSASAARRIRDCVASQLLPRTLATLDEKQPKISGAGAGLFALIALTTFAVSYVSVLWVPAYFALMIVIFVTPRRRSKLVNKRGEGVHSEIGKPDDVIRNQARTEASGLLDLDLDLDLGLGSNPDSVIHDVASESLVGDSDSLVYGNTKPRRGRSRTRKTAKSSLESNATFPSVTWIRVGPGKFVRADFQEVIVDQAQTNEIPANVIPETAALAEMPGAPFGGADASTDEHALNSSQSTSGDVELVAVPVERVLESVAEEYGIAPSVFRSNSPVETSDAGFAVDENGAGQATHVRRSVSRVPRGIVRLIPSGNRSYLQRRVSNEGRARTLDWRVDFWVGRLNQGQSRGFRSARPMQRPLRTRSPPIH